MDRIDAMTQVAKRLCEGEYGTAEALLRTELPFAALQNTGRSYSVAAKLEVFFQDGFIDRYSGERLLNPGYLRALSRLFPDAFPFHSNWRMEACHLAFWQYTPTIDHLIPVARGGADDDSNWVTTNMLHNSAKSNWLLEELNWQLHPPGDWRGWNGLSKEFVRIVEQNPLLKEDSYIKQWYMATKKMLAKHEQLS